VKRGNGHAHRYPRALLPYFASLREQRRISVEAWAKIAWRNADRILGLGLASLG
jgi:hypothetical protein